MKCWILKKIKIINEKQKNSLLEKYSQYIKVKKINIKLRRNSKYRF